MDKKGLTLQVHNLKFEVSDEKPNWMPFTGACAFVDTPTDGIPCSDGCIDKSVIFPRDEVEKSIDTLLNMAVDCIWPEWGDPGTELTGHDHRNKIGVITSASIVGNEIVISGGLWSWDFYDICDTIKLAKSALGWSVELCSNIDDAGENIMIRDIEFTGVALMYSDAAAFKSTYLAAQNRKGVERMNKEEMQAMLDDLLGKVKEEISSIDQKVETLASDFAAEKELREQEKKEALELAAKEKAEADAKLAEEAKVAAELAAKKEADELAAKEAEEAKRKTKVFPGLVVSKFSEASDEVKAVVADEKLSGSQKFQKLINLKLQAKE